MTRLIISLVLIFLSLLAGYWYQRKVLGPNQSLATSPKKEKLFKLRDRLQFFAFFLLMPLSSMLSLWGLPDPDQRLLCLPLFGLCAWTLGGILSLWGGHLLRLPRPQIGSLFCCGAFSNIGAVGGLVCVLFFGEMTIAYVALYRLLEEIFYYGLAIPVASRYREDPSKAVTVQGLHISHLLICIVAALACGFLLNFFKIPRPDFLGTIAAQASILAATLALFSIGLGLTPSKLTSYKLPCGIVLICKFLLIPICLTLAAYLLGLGQIEGGLPLRVVLILSCMPVAMNALLPPALLGLDLDLANACWIQSTLALALVLPILALVILPFF
ncbi:MAG: hypothetical protein IJS50_04835 [Desulfovibrio sp.]|nr:hypothetical protein [Desulfovibrio sp.]